ncbi:MAG: cation-translocating P-type ATPase [Sandaracinaceae bacterium]
MPEASGPGRTPGRRPPELTLFDPPRDVPWHAIAPDQAVHRLATDAEVGLSAAEAEERLARHGANALPEPPRPSALVQLLRQFADPLVGALLVAAGVAFAVALTEADADPVTRYSDTVAILLIVALNAILGFVQERRAEAALAALSSLAAPSAKVLRAGEVRTIDARALVPGDVVELAPGDAVPADVRLLTSADLAAQEAALTGESTSVDKRAEATLPEATPVAEQRTMVFLGTTVVRGQARGVVSRTGPATELGRIGALLRSSERTATPLEERLHRLGRILLTICLALSALVFVLGILQGERSWTLMLLTAVSLAVAAIPEGLPAITTITLAIGMQRMAARGAIVRKLPAVETLGSATVICTDKTGTLTENRMTVQWVVTAEARYEVTGEGYAAEGEVRRDGEVLDALPPSVEETLRIGALCNSASFEDTPEGRRVVGDPTEAALLALGAKVGLARPTLLATTELVRVYPFDSDRRRMAVVLREGGGAPWGYVKGSPDVIVPRCQSVLGDDGERRALDGTGRGALLARAEALAGEAFRVLALASKAPLEGTAEPEEGLTFAGLVAIHDPLRPEATRAVEECRKAGISVRMITGDHRLTAVAIGRKLGIYGPGTEVISGAELETLGPEQLAARLERATIFARVTAEQKLRLVRAHKARGDVVAMTGDGVNDAPALREAQIGVAMGRAGTDVAREAAAMVLADDNFATIVEAVREGRAIFRNIQKFVFFLNSSNAGLVVAVIAGSFFPWMPQLTPLQLLWVNLVTNGLPALALGVDPPVGSQMTEPPRPVKAGIIGRSDLAAVLLVGLSMGGAALALYWLPDLAPGWIGGATRAESLERARAMAFCLLAVAPLVHAFSCRSGVRSVFSRDVPTNRMLWAAVTASLAIHLVSVLVPPLHRVFRTHLLTGTEWAAVLALSALPLLVMETWKAVRRGRDAARRSARP